MPTFQVVENASSISAYEGWTDVPEFKSKNRIVDVNGCVPRTDYQGHSYQIISKKEHIFSLRERIGRIFKGMLLIIVSFGWALTDPSIRGLFSKWKGHIRYGIPRDQTPFVVSNNETMYLWPKVLFPGTKLPNGEKLNFVLINQGSETKLLAVTSADEYATCKVYKGTPLEAFLKLAQDPHPEDIHAKGVLYMLCHKNALPQNNGKSLIKFFLEHPCNSLVTEKDFFSFVFGKDEKGIPGIFTLSQESVKEVLTIAKEKHIPIDFKSLTAQGETLLEKWAKQKQFEIPSLIVELDPTALEELRPHIRALAESSVFVGCAQNLLGRLAEGSLSQDFIWIQRAKKNDANFSDEEFLKLDPDLQKLIYFLANAYRYEDLVKRLNALGMLSPPKFLPGGPSQIVAENMDIVSAKCALEEFLKTLRKNKLLLTTDEFSKLDQTKYLKKNLEIGRIQGRNFIEKMAQECGLHHIKVPRKIIVVPDGTESLSLKVDTDGMITYCAHSKYHLYADLIESVNRKLSLEEGIEFMIILEKTGFNDFRGQNIYIAEDGLYFVDTEFTNFSPETPCWKSIKLIKDLLDMKDVEPFLAAYRERKAQFERQPVNKVEGNKSPSLLSGYAGDVGYTMYNVHKNGHKFTFKLSELVGI